MSTGAKTSYAFAMTLASRMIDLLSPHCLRVEIAGSLRRKKPLVNDIEIVLIPAPLCDLFGVEIYGAARIEAALRDDGFKLIKNGAHYKQARLPGGKIAFDLFLTTPECWGVIYTILTGSADFSHRLVTPRRLGGLLPSDLRIKGGRIWRGDTALDTPEEADVFRVCGIDWVEPDKRY